MSITGPSKRKSSLVCTGEDVELQNRRGRSGYEMSKFMKIQGFLFENSNAKQKADPGNSGKLKT